VEIIEQDSTALVSLIQDKLAQIDTLLHDQPEAASGERDLLSEVRVATQDFLDAVQSSATEATTDTVARGQVNSSQAYSDFWSAVSQDLNALYAATDKLGIALKDQYNYAMADLQNLLLQLKIANAGVANYELYSKMREKNERRFVENYNDYSKIELNSSLLGDTQCNVDTIEGIATLGILSTTITRQDDVDSITTSPTTSNGTTYGDTGLIDIVNSNDLRLFEYELTSTSRRQYVLTLDFVVKFKTPRVINHIRIVPNNFGTKTWPKITALDISTDGLSAENVRATLLGDSTDETSFILAPYASNYAGEGRYSFAPQSVQFVHITIRQTDPYYDTARNLYRWAIGLKNIEIAGIEYAATSEVVSAPLAVRRGIDQVAVDSEDLPPVTYDEDNAISSLGQVLHDISVDGGMSWKTVQQQYITGAAYPEVLNVNNVISQASPTAANSIVTPLEATSLRHRLRLKRISGNIGNDLANYFSPVVRKTTIKVITKEAL